MFIAIAKQIKINIETETREERTMKTPKDADGLRPRPSFINGMHDKALILLQKVRQRCIWM